MDVLDLLDRYHVDVVFLALFVHIRQMSPVAACNVFGRHYLFGCVGAHAKEVYVALVLQRYGKDAVALREHCARVGALTKHEVQVRTVIWFLLSCFFVPFLSRLAGVPCLLQTMYERVHCPVFCATYATAMDVDPPDV